MQQLEAGAIAVAEAVPVAVVAEAAAVAVVAAVARGLLDAFACRNAHHVCMAVRLS